MLSYNDLKKGTLFVWNGEPYEVLEYNFSRMQQRKPVAQTKIRNLKTGTVSSQTFKTSDAFDALEIEKRPVVFIFCNRGQCTFHSAGNSSERFILSQDILGGKEKYMKPKEEIVARYIPTHSGESELLDIVVPIKVDLMVTEAPPAVRGNTAQGGLKQVVLETGLVLNVPLFVNSGDTLRINTESGEYVERVSK
ncbi:MAG: elongation factor P [Parcubacteria group bacterium Gr01-1014_29]|nr:MAG: elongation factor P [Parcubacteria group bacterium Gr01-1014_29]